MPLCMYLENLSNLKVLFVHSIGLAHNLMDVAEHCNVLKVFQYTFNSVCIIMACSLKIPA